ncbi:MAG: hypothetical protein Q8Q42_01630 [Nanoarchaeota archaeon]|nr:hypothetical protein [Nanoarchaeota archaeon]
MAKDFDKLLRFYARRDIQDAIIEVSKDREVAVCYNGESFGKRPDILQYPSDVLELARKGVTSFHISEERWQNPLEIITGMRRKELDSLRIGWDCVLDIDSPYFEYSQITTYLLCEALKFYGIKSYGVKFSGRKGFHIVIPFEAFPKEVAGKSIKDMFPEGSRKIAEFLGNIIFEKLSERILSEQKIEEISNATGKTLEELQTPEGKFNPFSVVDIDTILISSRHLFRSLYSVNEKSWLISVPVDNKRILEFKLGQAKIENVNIGIKFLKKPETEEARSLIIQAFDAPSKPSLMKRSTIIMGGKDYFEKETSGREFKMEDIDNTLLREEHLPPCIKLLLNGLQGDGRKRALFILMNFYKGLNYSQEEIIKKINEWNNKNYEPLREGYVISQLSSLMKNPASFLPPNCANEGYYKDIGVCKPVMLCQKIKNPLNFTLLKMKSEKQKKPKKIPSPKK